VARMGVERNVYKLVAGKSEVKSSLGRTRRRWTYNIKLDLLGIRFSGVDCVGLAQNR
jgi:hypothetical protein